MKPEDLTTEQVRQFAGTVVSVRMRVDHTNADRDDLLAAIRNDMRTNISTRVSFGAYHRKVRGSQTDQEAGGQATIKVDHSTNDHELSTADLHASPGKPTRAERAMELRGRIQSQAESKPAQSPRARQAMAAWLERRATANRSDGDGQSGGMSDPSRSPSRAERAMALSGRRSRKVDGDEA